MRLAAYFQVVGPFKGHTKAVEDIVWSPTESTVLASCGGDGSLKVWDTRDEARSPKLSVTAAQSTDVNVIAWSPAVTYTLASGDDDGQLCVWDLRMFRKEDVEYVARFRFHKEAITSVEWCPHEASMLVTSGADH